ncbi:hypothetical protein LUZ61_012024 [Rhynchospora tenuis]|uniref:non-specific serine/threonine protein kinase n=1 Tax=Rhynchospora tenuis TaxID=198213 RepID=A0AAD6A247_9POAL|nr:hypothetical protein LUZ61_012024 [Rhynchospora tenuis]
MLINLEQLHLSRNNLSGELPEELGNCQVLTILALDSNSFQGTIPSFLSNLNGLEFINLSCNNFSGVIPQELGLLNELQELYLAKNILSGHIPLVIENLTNLYMFDISYNDIEGSVPEKGVFSNLAQATESFATSNLIGAGKYSHVYKGVLLSKGEGSSNQKSNAVAVKVFDLQQLGSSKGFMVECEALRLIRHRNLIRIRTCCSTFDYNGNDFKALVFDYMPNGNLHRWLHPEIDELKSLRPLSLTQRLSIVIDIADALDYLHHNCYPSVIHCDLKPSNILLGEDFSACVGDFGLAKLLPDPVSKSLVESESSIGIRGSIGYVPPEYGDGGPVSTAGDAYSFGVLLLEIFTGKNPTELMFKDGLTLHNFVEMAFPEQVMDIVDPNLIALDVMENISFKKMREFLVSIIEVGLTCSKQWPIDRMSMEDVATQLHRIKDVYLPNINC